MADIPKDGKSAAAFVGLFSMLTSLISWSFSLIFSALLAREVAHRVRGADYRAVGAAAYLGMGSVWALRAVVVGGAHHGGARLSAAVDSADQRRDSAEPDARAGVAEPAPRALVARGR